ncbi:MAG: hypothetical protein HY765_09985 [Rhodomicrobium sp.]|nr:hypothetical protein [Rhodomicrobium sp.]
MKLAKEFANSGLDEIKAALDGGVLKIYTVVRPSSPDIPITRSGLVATYQFASPAFPSDAPQFASNPVNAENVGTPGFARAFKADGVTPVADFSAGPGNTEIKLNEVSAVAGYPLAVTSLKLELPAA